MATPVGTWAHNRGEISMKFKLRTAGRFYTEENKEILGTLGFKFKEETSTFTAVEKYCLDDSVQPTQIINTLEELLEFTVKYGDIIMREDNTIIIYDDYIE